MRVALALIVATLLQQVPRSIWHTPYPGESSDVLRVTVNAEQGAHMEVLAYYFPVVAPDSALLRLQWGTTIVPVWIKPKP